MWGQSAVHAWGGEYTASNHVGESHRRPQHSSCRLTHICCTASPAAYR